MNCAERLHNSTFSLSEFFESLPEDIEQRQLGDQKLSTKSAGTPDQTGVNVSSSQAPFRSGPKCLSIRNHKISYDDSLFIVSIVIDDGE